MFPASYFALFPPFPRDDRVFVAMSFDAQFDRRWSEVLVPAISDVRRNDNRLMPHRVDLSRRGDSILTEILDELARCRLILADVSTVGRIADRPVRNANVFYEFGLAHASRLAEEVVLLRSDSDPLPFDIANVRVHSYNPDGDPAGARELVRSLIRDALATVDSVRSRTVERIVESLDFECFDVLFATEDDGGATHPSRNDILKGMAIWQASARIAAIQRLLELGALSADFQRITAKHIGGNSELPKEDLVRYRRTPLGDSVLRLVLDRLDYFSPEVRAAFASKSAAPPT